MNIFFWNIKKRFLHFIKGNICFQFKLFSLKTLIYVRDFILYIIKKYNFKLIKLNKLLSI